jgi:polysaccharide deacetylase family protein (PEP-CTERM system associated)
MLNALTVDVEDYFQVTAFERYICRDEWEKKPARVYDNTQKILALFDELSVKGTFFVLGWVAERFPELVKEISRQGHEIACHGYGHELVYKIGPDRFRSDIRRAKACIEDIIGVAIEGYRAPSYSITKDALWALDILIEEGFTYDSSIFPVYHDIYGIPDSPRFPYKISRLGGTILEFPLTTFPVKFAGRELRVPIAGGGYLRLFPASIISHGISRINRCDIQPTVLYFHPWEIDPTQPRIRAGIKSRFRHYLNLHKMEGRLRFLLKNIQYGTMREVLTSLDTLQTVLL